MSRQLRHSRSLIVNGCGFAWVDDLISIMYIEDQTSATAAQIYYVVAKDKQLRFQLVQQASTDGRDPKHFVIRAVHGHSKSIQDQMRNNMAHTLAMEHIPIMAHATYSEPLRSIIGLGAPGLLPGRTRAKGTRHVHCASELPSDQDPGKSLVGFRGKGVDVAIALDAVSMHRTTSTSTAQQRVCSLSHLTSQWSTLGGSSLAARAHHLQTSRTRAHRRGLRRRHYVRMLRITMAARYMDLSLVLGTAPL